MMMPEREYTRRFKCNRDFICFISTIIISLILFGVNVYLTILTSNYFDKITNENNCTTKQ